MIPVCHFSDSSRTSLSLLWRQTVRSLSACLLSMVGKRHITNIWSSFNSTTSSCSSGVQTLSLLWVRWLWQGRLHPTTGLLINPMTCLHTRCVPLWADPSGMALEDVCNMHVSKVSFGPQARFSWYIWCILSTHRYHTGSLAFGSLILAIVQIIRVLLEYIDHKLKGKRKTLTDQKLI